MSRVQNREPGGVGGRPFNHAGELARDVRPDRRMERRMARIENHDGRAWRARAAECRAIADTFQNRETREKMYLIAADYERMAENADQRQQEMAASGGAGQARSDSERIKSAAERSADG